jgi:hypothetical protein
MECVLPKVRHKTRASCKVFFEVEFRLLGWRNAVIRLFGLKLRKGGRYFDQAFSLGTISINVERRLGFRLLSAPRCSGFRETHSAVPFYAWRGGMTCVYGGREMYGLSFKRGGMRARSDVTVVRAQNRRWPAEHWISD